MVILLFGILIVLKLVIMGQLEDTAILYIPDILLVSISVIFLGIRAFASRLSHRVAQGVLSIIFIVLAACLSAILNAVSIIDTLISLSRTIAPFLVFFTLKENSRNSDFTKERSLLKLAYGLSTLVLILVLVGIATNSGIVNRGSTFLPSYFPGLHSSAYILGSSVAMLFAVLLFEKTKGVSIYLSLYFLFALYMLLFGWAIRTVALVYLAYAILVYLRSRGVNPRFTIFFGLTALIITGMFLFTFQIISYADIVSATSGRTEMYVEKVRFLSENSIGQWLMGRGFGSDMMISDIWWWDAKGSHNDFLTFQTEGGATFILFLFLLLWSAFRCIDGFLGKALFLMSLVSSLGSNGILVRPSGAYLLMIALVLLSVGNRRSSNDRVPPRTKRFI